MRAFVLRLIGILILGLVGCSAQPFPGGPDSSGFRDVPFLETYLFDFKTGAGPISRDNPDGNLQIISAADLMTLLNAAQDQQTLGLGVVSGLVLYNGSPVQDVALKVTDADGNLLAIRMEGKKIGNDLVLPDGLICPPENATSDNICIKGSIYYNSPGGVPDFSNNLGTSTAGSYTIFNLPPGDVYLWASRGGRGNGRIKVFADRISIGKLQVVPFSVSTVSVTGSVIEAEEESTAVPQASISVLGTKDPGLTTLSDSSGLYEFASIGTNGNYLLKVSKAGHWDTYHSMNTTPFQTSTDTDIESVTKTVTSYSNSYIGKIAQQGKIPADPNMGIITGRVKAGDGTPQHCAKVTVKDKDGNDLTKTQNTKLVYVDGPRDSCVAIDPSGNQDPNQTSLNGLFFIINVPPGEVFVSYTSQVQNGSGQQGIVTASGGMIVPSFPGVVFVQDMTNSGTDTPRDLSGKVIDAISSASVPSAQLTFLGVSPQSVSSDGTGAYDVPNLLIGGQTYRVKVSKSGSDTYQLFNMADSATKHNFLILQNSTPPSGQGEIDGLFIDQNTGQTAQNVTVRITDLAGNPIAGGQITSSDGTFRIPNVPIPSGSSTTVNLSVISGDDSGNATLQVYSGGVTYFQFIMTKVIPSQVAVSGTIKDLAGANVGGAQIRALGKSSVISADGSGHYQGSLESFGRFIIKTQKDSYYDTYNFFPSTGVLDNLAPIDLFSISRGQVAAAAAQAGVAQSSANGVIVGSTVQNSFLPNICTGCLGTGPHTAALGYFNQDTIIDIAITNQTDNSVTVLFGDGSGGFGNPKTIPVGKNPTGIVMADVDGNGTADLIVTNQGDNTITVLLGDKNGNFSPVTSPLVDVATPVPQPLSPSPLNSPVAIATGLFDSDTIPDIAIVNGNGSNSDVLVLLGNGNGTFHPIYQNNNIQRNPLGSAPKAIVAADFNQDQRMDMAISNSGDGTITVLLGSTDGTFHPLSDPNTNAPIVLQVGGHPEAMTLADFNADGRLDLAVLDRGAGTVTILKGNASGGFDPLTDANQNPLPAINVGTNPSGLTVGEFNGDGRADLAIIRGDQSLLVLLGNGDGRFTPGDPIALGDSPQNILLSDQNRDGIFDLVVVGATDVIDLLGTQNPVGGISIEARDLNGARVGTVGYLNSAGQIHTELNTTSVAPGTPGFNGGFII